MTSLPALLSCLLLASRGSADQGNHHRMEEMLSKMASKMLELQEQVEKIEDKNVELRMEMKRKDGEMEKKVAMLETKSNRLTAKLKEVEQKSVKGAPYVMSCAARNTWPTRNATISYEYISAEFNNADQPDGADGIMDITTGVYTALTAGVYEVTFSAVSVLDAGDDQYFFLMHNEESAGDEGEWWSRADPGNAGKIYDMGSRTLVSV
jgi:hypothetical protein